MKGLGLPLVFGGMATAALLLLVYKGSTLMRFVGATTLALLAGFVGGAHDVEHFDRVEPPMPEIVRAQRHVDLRQPGR